MKKDNYTKTGKIVTRFVSIIISLAMLAYTMGTIFKSTHKSLKNCEDEITNEESSEKKLLKEKTRGKLW